MGLINNRIRTITGKDTPLVKSISRLFYYAANKKRIAKLVNKCVPFLNRKPSYLQWLKQNQYTDKSILLKKISALSVKPPLHIIIFGNDENKIQKTITSIISQEYTSFEIFVLDIHIAAKNNIKYVSFSDLYCKQFVNNEFLLFVDSGDLLSYDCLYLIANEINSFSKIKCIYFDEDKISAKGRRHSPNFKPGWSPDLILNYNYISHAFIHHSLLNRSICEASNAKVATEKIIYSNVFDRQEISNIKRVLLSSPEINIHEHINEGETSNLKGEQLISIIIPTRNKSELVSQCVLSIIEKSTYKNFEIILVDNKSDEVALQEIIVGFVNRIDLDFKVVSADIEFNFSALINIGVENSKGELLVLLNNDIQIISSDWMEQMAFYALKNHTGVVGAKLLYPDNTIQHAGIVLEEENISKHVFLGRKENEIVESNALNTTRNYLALTAACLMVKKENFLKVDGFDTRFIVEFNDIDFCLKLYKIGYYNVFLPTVKFYHYESASRRHPHSDKRSYKQHLLEVSLMRKNWAKYLANDPYNTNRF